MDIEQLKKLAEAATPGEWFSQDGEIISRESGSTVISDEYHGNMIAFQNTADAAFIAAANPQTVLALIKELEEARRDAAQRIIEISATKGYGMKDDSLFADSVKEVCAEFLKESNVR